MADNNLRENPYPLGAHAEGGAVRFSFASKAASCGIMLYDKASGRLRQRIPFAREDRTGYVYCRKFYDIDPKDSSYLFFEEDYLVPDERARVFSRKIPYGRDREAEDLKAGFLTEGFDWGEDRPPRIPYNKVVAYCMHVRGFTKHASSGVVHRGTFAGIAEKIPYLKEIGVTTLELQPAYEFMEIPMRGECRGYYPYMAEPGVVDCPGKRDRSGGKPNYWGYKKGFYYMPKAAYAASDNASAEFKELVKALHANGMELIMQFYFPVEVKRSEIPEILRFWVLEYHVDGFHLLGENLQTDLLAAEDLLADTKLWYYHFDTGKIYGREEKPLYPHAAEYNDAWYYDMRRFLKGDGGMLNGMLYHMRHIPEKAGCIHYLSNYYGFTLADMVSYDYKHNEANGEDNRDGSDYNCSWNCGDEGATRRQSVRRLRMKQMKNALCLLMLSQSTPLIFMGDEFGNSQKGNNNPYCQDNAIAWLDWGGMTKNAELLEFWKMLAEFRRSHPILRPEKELRLMDYIACGYPDLSYHGRNAWSPQTEEYYRHIGIMLCGIYEKSCEAGRETADTFLYLAFNMHWESHKLALPRLPKGMKWETAFGTERREQGDRCEAELMRSIPPRSITVFVSSVREEK
ncbi:MAG: hypothetical protein HFH91_13580 [Lachnospiraceae bacterium]|nr:hypothetical protein [Lachnospiraceae bacterium]